MIWCRFGFGLRFDFRIPVSPVCFSWLVVRRVSSIVTKSRFWPARIRRNPLENFWITKPLLIIGFRIPLIPRCFIILRGWVVGADWTWVMTLALLGGCMSASFVLAHSRRCEWNLERLPKPDLPHFVHEADGFREEWPDGMFSGYLKFVLTITTGQVIRK